MNGPFDPTPIGSRSIFESSSFGREAHSQPPTTSTPLIPASDPTSVPGEISLVVLPDTDEPQPRNQEIILPRFVASHSHDSLSDWGPNAGSAAIRRKRVAVLPGPRPNAT